MKLLIIFFITFLHSSCSRKSASEPFKAKLPFSKGGSYEFQEVTFSTLENLDRLEGTIAKIKGNSVVDIAAETGEIIESKNEDDLYIQKGQDIFLDYKLENGVVHARNFDSLAMLSIYYYYERTFNFWQDNLGLKLSDFEKIDIIYNPRIGAKTGQSILEVTIKINAAFLPGMRDFWFFKTSKSEDLPINMNWGVIAHEFGHGIFDLYFNNKDATITESDVEENDEILSGINEGLADFFSYMVTGSTKEFGLSLAIMKEERTLPVAWKDSEIEDSDCTGGFYCRGSVLASALYEIANATDQNAIKVGKVVIDALPVFEKDWSTYKNEKDNFEIYYLLNRILEKSADDQSVYCDSFKKWFDKAEMQDKIKC